MTLMLERLEVSAFMAIAKAEVSFGPGLTVLHGPNDLGKSTLVTALRAALLLPASSSDADAYRPWYSSQTPRVVLTFRDDTGLRWRISKVFGDSAELHTSKDGATWTLSAKAREVDEKVRRRLGWGAPDFKGKAGVKGMPTTFLANALLGEQTGVDALLGQSLKGDPGESGRQHLTQVLSVLAQDPLFKTVLTQAQAEVGAYFTPTGQQKRGATSPFKRVSEEVKTLTEQLEQVKKDLFEARATEEKLGLLRAELDAATAREQEALTLLQTVRAAQASSAQRAELERAVTVATAHLASLDEQVAKAKQLEVEAAQAGAALQQVEVTHTQATAAVEAARRALSNAEAQLTRAQSGDAERAAELERAKLLARQAELSGEVTRLLAQRDDARREVQRHKDRLAATAALQSATRERATLEDTLTKTKTRLAEAAQRALFSTWLLDFGHVRRAEAEVSRAESAVARANELKQQAAQLDAAVQDERSALERDVAALEVTKVPEDAVVAKLRDLWTKKREADAHAGGGLSVVVKPKESLRLHVEVDDDAPVEEARVTAERLIDAERRVRLSLGHLVDIEISSGRKEQRAMADLLSRRWKKEALPVFADSGVTSIEELEEAVAHRRDQRASLERRRMTLEAKAREVTVLRDQAAREAQQTSAVSRDELVRKRDRIPKEQLGVIEQAFPGLGDEWEREATRLLDEARLQESTARETVSRTEVSLAAARERVTATTVALEALGAPSAGDAAARLAEREQALAACQATLAETAARVEAVQTTRGTQVKAAEAALEQARKALQTAQAHEGSATSLLRETQAKAVEAKTRAAAQAELVASQDRATALQALEAAQARFAPVKALPQVTPAQVASTEDVVAAAEREREAAFGRLSAEQGILGRLAGPSVRERHAQLEEALTLAKQKEQQVELEAKSWLVLRDTLREAENSQTAHLGQALAGPLTSTFSELTGGRYGTVGLDAHLQLERVGVTSAATGGDDVVAALSVGTRDQLATLVRLALAQHLHMPLVLDDHLVHTDVARLSWFRKKLLETALETQVLVFTCREADYLPAGMTGGPGGQLTVVDLSKAITPWPERLAAG